MKFDSIFFTEYTDSISSIPPLGAYKCAHVLRKNGYTSLVVNHYSSFTIDEMYKLIDLVAGPTTKLVGFSTTFVKSTNIKKVAGQPTPAYPELPSDTVFPQGKDFENLVIARLKKCSPNIKTVIGGATVNAQYSNRNINYVCIGYSESSIVNLMNHLTHGHTLEKSMRNIWGLMIIDDRKAESYDFSTGDMNWLPYDVVNHKTLPIEIARGCVFKCKFCGFPMNGKKKLDFIKCEHILKKELEDNYKKFNITDYIIVDDTFNDHIEKIKNISNMIQTLSFNPKFWGYHRLDLLSTKPETISLLYDMGIRSMYFGIETLDPAAAKAVGKGYDRDKQIETIRYIRTNYPDITMNGGFIIGLPGETEESIISTHNKILNQDIPLHSWHFKALTIKRLPYVTHPSEFEKTPEEFGYIDQGPADGVSNTIINWKSDQMSYLRAKELQKEFEKLDHQSETLLMQGQSAFEISSMGHSAYTIESVSRTQFLKFDFYNIEENVRKEFIKNYKRTMFNMLTNNVN